MGKHTLRGESGNKGKWTKKKIAAIAGVLLLAAAFFIYELIGVSRVATGLMETRDSLAQAQTQATNFDLAGAQDSFASATESLAKARSGIGFFGWMKPLPWVGDQVIAVSAMMDAGAEAADSVDAALGIAIKAYAVIQDAQPSIEAQGVSEQGLSFESLPEDVRADLLEVLYRSSKDLDRIQVNMHLAADDLARIDDVHAIPPIQQASDSFRSAMPMLLSAVDFFAPLAASLDQTAGINADRQWLILFMNDMELRPGGGFLGVFGLATIRDGRIETLDASDTYAVDSLVQNDASYQVAPPDPIRDYIGVDKWYFRDANWSPDFAVSSKDSVQLLRQELAQVGQAVPEIHGVIGFTPTFASSILAVTGDITVNGETFTAENLPQTLEFAVEEGYVDQGIAFSQRKEIVEALTKEVVDRLMKLPIDQYGNLFAAITGGFSQKHLALYSPDESTQAIFHDAGWTGEVNTSGTDDVLSVVDANMISLKTDPAVSRSISYHIEKQGDAYVATTAITYDHTGEYDFYTSRYRTYTRVYAPLGSVLTGSAGAASEVRSQDDLGMTSFGAFIVIEPGESKTLSFTYTLPESVGAAIESGVYELRVLKQMGSQNYVLTLDLDFDKKMKAAQPAEERSAFGDTRYTVNTTIDQDKDFVIELE